MHKKRQCFSRLKKAKITSGVPVAKVQNSHFATAAIKILVSRQLNLLPKPAKKCFFAAANSWQRHRYVTAPTANYRNCRLGFKTLKILPGFFAGESGVTGQNK